MNKFLIFVLILIVGSFCEMKKGPEVLKKLEDSLTDCTPPDSPLKITNLDWQPHTHLQIGQLIKVVANGTISETVTGGSAKLTVEWFFAGGWHPLPSFNFDGCT